MTADISDFYLNTPMERPEYMRIPVRDIPACIMDQYQLHDLVHNGHVMVEIRKGMYGLPQAGRLANERLVKHLALHGFVPCTHTAGLYRHLTRPIYFSLIVDDFGVLYVGRVHAEFLLTVLEAQYPITTDWTGTLYCGITLAWDYEARTVDLSMPGYVAKALTRFQHAHPTRPQHSPYYCAPPVYGTAVQLTAPIDTSAPLAPSAITFLREVIGVFLFYGRAIDNTLLVALGTLASSQAHGTEATLNAVTFFLNYCATHPDAVVRYHASDMALHVHSDASYLSETQARSRIGGYFYLSNHLPDPLKPPTADSTLPPINGPVHVNSSILSNVMSSAAEAELGALFYNAKDAVMLRTTLEELGYKQAATPLQTDNACAAGIANDTVKQRRSKAIDMRFYWVKDRVKQGEFLVYWRRGLDNLADYFTKHHAPAHHRRMRHHYLHVDG
jgi:hypothetical protein